MDRQAKVFFCCAATLALLVGTITGITDASQGAKIAAASGLSALVAIVGGLLRIDEHTFKHSRH